MFSEKRKNHWSSIFQETLKSLRGYYILLIISIINIQRDGLFMILFVAILSLIVGCYKYLTRKFYITDDLIILEWGLINKKKIKIPFDKINTIDISRNLLDKVANTLTIKIDSGAVKSKEEEIKLNLKSEEGYSLRDYISNLKSKDIDECDIEGKEEKVLEKSITFKELFIYSLTKGKLIWFISIIFIVIEMIGQYEESSESTFLGNIMEYVQNKASIALEQEVLLIIVYFLALFIVISVAINIGFIIFEGIRLYNFNIKADKTNIYIKYGLLKSKEYTIPIKKVYALKYKQSILQQIFKIFTLEAVTIGYGDEKNEAALLYPLANKKFIEEFVYKLLPDFKNYAKLNKPPKRAMLRFIIKRNVVLLILISIFMCIFTINIKVLVLGSIGLVTINSILGYINYKNTSLSVDEKVIVTSTGSLNKETNIIKQDSVQSVTIIEGPFHRWKQVVDFKIDIYTNNLLSGMVKIDNMDKIVYNEVEKNLKL